MDPPLEDVRLVLDDPAGKQAMQVLADHHARIERTRDHLSRQLAAIGGQLKEGIDVPTSPAASAPVQIKIAVDDIESARTFYREALGFEEQVVRHTDSTDYTAFQFGTPGKPGFFLLPLLAEDGPEFDRPGPSTSGVLVDELDTTHARALAAGGSEVVASKDAQGMPRHSALRDSSGNCIWLYQG